MLKLLWLLAAQPQFVDCGCLCVDGVARTLCQTVEEAQLHPSMCPAGFTCPVPPVAEPGAPAYYDAPADHAQNCREVRVWDESAGGYTGVKVCDVFTG